MINFEPEEISFVRKTAIKLLLLWVGFWMNNKKTRYRGQR